jgi:hypothetical protein
MEFQISPHWLKEELEKEAADAIEELATNLTLL